MRRACRLLIAAYRGRVRIHTRRQHVLQGAANRCRSEDHWMCKATITRGDLHRRGQEGKHGPDTWSAERVSTRYEYAGSTRKEQVSTKSDAVYFVWKARVLPLWLADPDALSRSQEEGTPRDADPRHTGLREDRIDKAGPNKGSMRLALPLPYLVLSPRNLTYKLKISTGRFTVEQETRE